MSKVFNSEDPKSFSIYSAGKKIKTIAISIVVISFLNFVLVPYFTNMEFKGGCDICLKDIINIISVINAALSISIIVLLFRIGTDLQDSAKEN